MRVGMVGKRENQQAEKRWRARIVRVSSVQRYALPSSIAGPGGASWWDIYFIM
jgi:hypothetical protein